MRRCRMFNILESSWLKAKLADNADVFSSRLTGSSPSQLQAPASPIRSLCNLHWQFVAEGQARSSPRKGPPRIHACTPQNTCLQVTHTRVIRCRRTSRPSRQRRCPLRVTMPSNQKTSYAFSRSWISHRSNVERSSVLRRSPILGSMGSRGLTSPFRDYTPHPTPCNLHPTPYTLHPTPYTLHPTPYTLHPTPCTLHPAPCTLHPAPCTLTLQAAWFEEALPRLEGFLAAALCS